MLVDLPEEDWLTILLALRQGGIGHRVRMATDRDACQEVAGKVDNIIHSAAEIRRLGEQLQCVTVVREPEPDVSQGDWEPPDASQAGAWKALEDLLWR